jgi:gluconolactonase
VSLMQPTRLVVLSAAAVLLGTIPASGQVAEPLRRDLIAPGVDLELLADVGIRTEGPVAAPDGSIYFVDLDIPDGGRIWRWDPVRREARPFREPSGVAAGLAIGRDGHLLTAEVASGGGRRIGRIPLPSGAPSTIMDAFDGRPIHGANDLVLDEAGRIYFTEYALLGPTDVLHRQGSGVYRVDPDGTIERIVADAGRPNGIAVSPDQRTLYVGSNRFDVLGNTAVLAYDLSAEGRARFREVLVRYPSSHLPDGMAVDRQGNLYVAMFAGARGVAVYDPTGRELGFIPTPGPATNVAFGLGEDDRSLYITAGTGLYRMRGERHGYHPSWRGSR